MSIKPSTVFGDVGCWTVLLDRVLLKDWYWKLLKLNLVSTERWGSPRLWFPTRRKENGRLANNWRSSRLGVFSFRGIIGCICSWGITGYWNRPFCTISLKWSRSWGSKLSWEVEHVRIACLERPCCSKNSISCARRSPVCMRTGAGKP